MVLTAGQVVLIFFIIIAWFGMAGICFCGELVYKRLSDRHNDPMDDFRFGGTSISVKEVEASLKKGVKTTTTTTTTTSENVLQYPDISKWKEFFEPKIDPGQPAIYNS